MSAAGNTKYYIITSTWFHNDIMIPESTRPKKDLAFTTLCAEIRKITNWIKIVLKLLNIFKCQKINDFLTIVKKICHVSLNFHFLKIFVHCEEFGKATTFFPQNSHVVPEVSKTITDKMYQQA